MSSNTMKTVTVNLNEEDVRRIEQLAAMKNISRTDALREAIATGYFIALRRAEGCLILTESRSGAVKTVEWPY